MKLVQENKDLRAKDGYRLLIVDADVTGGSLERLRDWGVIVWDASNESHERSMVSTSEGTGGKSATWTFAVPEGQRSFRIAFPGAAPIDLAPLLSPIRSSPPTRTPRK